MVPCVLFTDHDIENGDEFSHSGDDRAHFRLSVCDEPFVEGCDFWVMFFGDDGGHVECVSHVSAASAGGSFSSKCPAVSVSRSDADESGDLFAVELSEFGEF